MRKLLLVFAAQGRALTSCRNREWGDCYDPSSASLNISVIRQVSAALAEISNAEFTIEYDVSPEACGAMRPDNPAQEAQNNLNQRLMRDLRDLFDSKQAYISCLAGTQQAAEIGLEALDRAYRSANLRPSTLDLHIYETDERKVDAILRNAQGVAAGLGVPLDIQEFK